jgi:hypothetical protein
MGQLDGSRSTQSRPRLPQRIVVNSLCATVQEFIEAYRGYFTADAWFVTSPEICAIGALATFSFELSDGTVVLRGVGRIAEVWSDGYNPFRCPGAWLEDLEAAPGCESVLERLMRCSDTRAQLAEGTNQVKLERSTLSYGMKPFRRPSNW